MTLPTYDKFVEPILRYLAEHPDGVPAAEAHEQAARVLALTDEQRALVLPSGSQRVYKNRAGWAHDRLKRAGLSSSPRRGYWQLTAAGLEYARTHPAPLPPDEVARLEDEYSHVRLTSPGPGEAPVPPVETPIGPPRVESPDDAMERALREIREAVAAELLETVLNASPQFFETLVLDLLHSMGYGTSRDDLQRVGGSGDEGIDGIISLDRLGLEKVYVQAKRWKEQVGRPSVQAFYGALAGQRADKGVFITTSRFSQQAIDFARSIERIVLVDGTRLAALMIEHGVGVSHRAVKVPKVDTDYFEE